MKWTEVERKDFRGKAEFEGVGVSNSVRTGVGSQDFFFLKAQRKNFRKETREEQRYRACE